MKNSFRLGTGFLGLFLAFSNVSFASTPMTVLDQIAFLMKSQEVREKVKKVTYINPRAIQDTVTSFGGVIHSGSAKCIGSLNMFSLMFHRWNMMNSETKTCTVGISIGECGGLDDQGRAEKTDIYANLSIGDLQCTTDKNDSN